MEILVLTIDAMLMMFLLIVTGFILRRMHILPSSTGSILAKVGTYILVPALNFYTWSYNCTIDTFKENSTLILWGTAVIAVAIALGYILCSLFVPKVSDPESAYQRNIYKYAMTFSNYGFIGTYLVLGVWGTEGLFKYSMFTLTMAFVCASWGVYVLVPKNSRPSFGVIIKSFFSVPTIGLLLGCFVGILGLTKYIPDFVMRAASNAGDCMGPVFMILAGVVIGNYDWKELITNKKVYIASLFRLILIPSTFLLGLHFFHVSKEIMTWVLIAYATPLGLNTIVYPAAYGQNTKTGASMTLISDILSLATVPLMYYIFVVLL